MKKTFSLSIWDIAFLLWGITDSVFSHSISGMIGQVVFLILSFFFCLKRRSFRIHYVFCLYFLFCVVCWLNIKLGFSIAPDESSFMLGVVLRNLLFLVFLFQYFLSLDYQKLKTIFILYCLLSSIGLLLLNYQSTGSMIMRDIDGSINGNAQAINDSIAIGWLIIDLKGKIRFRDILLALFFIAFCLLAGTKKAIIGVLILVSVYVLLSSPRKIIKNVISVSALLIIVYLLLMKVDFFYNLIGERFEALFRFFNDADTDGSTNTRNNLIILGLTKFNESPIWGHGINTFKELREAFGTYSHNNYIELLFSIGIVGTIAFYSMYVFPLVNSIKKYLTNHSKYIVFPIALIICCLVLDYAFVSYYERATLVRITAIYFLSSNMLYRSSHSMLFN